MNDIRALGVSDQNELLVGAGGVLSAEVADSVGHTGRLGAGSYTGRVRHSIASNPRKKALDSSEQRITNDGTVFAAISAIGLGGTARFDMVSIILYPGERSYR